LRARDVDAIQMGKMIGALNGMVDTLSNLERIRTSPVPLAYSIHLRQMVLLYRYALPFQLVDPVKAMG
jgi:putative membrane protein